MKILMVTTSLDDGGVARIVSDLSMGMPTDWEVDILLSHSDDIRYPYKGNMISLHMPEPVSRTSLLYQIKLMKKRVVMLNELKKKNGYDMCISFLESANAANILSKTRNCKTVATVEAHMSTTAKYNWKYKLFGNPIIRYLYRRADKVVICSDEGKDDLIKNYNLNSDLIKRIYCSVDIEEIKDKAEEFVVPQNEERWFSKAKTVITAGRYVQQKGHWHLIRSFKRVLDKIPDAKLVIFGDGPYRENYERMISDLNLQESILLHDYSQNLGGYIKKSSVFVMPSIYEGFPTATLIAMACGVPVVASDFVSGAREQLAPGYTDKIDATFRGEFGIITSKLSGEVSFDPGEYIDEGEKALADGMTMLLEDESLRHYYSNQAQNRVQDFDSKIVCQEWIEFIENECRQRK